MRWSLGVLLGLVLACGPDAGDARGTAASGSRDRARVSSEPHIDPHIDPHIAPLDDPAGEPRAEHAAHAAHGSAPAPSDVPRVDASCPPNVGEAIRIAQEALMADGMRADAFAGCDAHAARCEETRDVDGSGARTEAIADRCRVRVLSEEDRVEVTFEPGPVAGAPDHAYAWLAPDLSRVGRKWIGASSYGVAREGALVVRGVTSHHRHTHGGDAARIDSASFSVRNQSGAPITLRPTRVRWKTGHGDCLPPTQSRAELHASYVSRTDDDANGGRAGAAEVEVPVGTWVVDVGFETQAAYYSWCDRFAASVTFEAADGTTVTADAEAMVTRVEPLRPRP